MTSPLVETGSHDPTGKRDRRLDALRGLALVLMILDHVLVVALEAGAPDELFWIRKTITRFSLPLFMVVSGMLLARRKSTSWRRWLEIACGALFVNCLTLIPVGFGLPDILLVWLLASLFTPLIIRFPMEVAIVGLLQAQNLPIPWGGYQLGWVVALLAIGVLATHLREIPLLNYANYLPAWVAAMGRRPLLWYVGHMTVVVVVGAVVIY